MTRVLVIEAAGNLRGSERSLLDILGSVPSLEVAVCSPPGTRLNAELSKRRIRALPYYVEDLHQRSRWHLVRAAIGVLRACLAFRPDVIHLNQSGSYKVVLPAALILRVPIVGHIRIFEDAAYLAQQRPSPARLATLIAISQAVENEIRRYPALSSIPVKRLYNAFVSQEAAEDAGQRRSEQIACVGRFVPIKAQDLLIDALGLLRDAEQEFRCLMIGAGDDEYIRQLRARATQRGVSARLEWTGFTSEIPALLRTCAVLVCPSHREPLGRVVLDAWDAGAVPIVFAGSGGAAEIVRAAEGGIVYSDQTPAALADALREGLSLSDDARARYIARGRTWMAANCDPAAYGLAFTAVLEHVARLRRAQRRTRALVVEAAGNLWGSERSLLDLLSAVPDLDVAVCCPPRMPLTAELVRRKVETLPYFVEGLHLKSKRHRGRAAFGVLRACLQFQPDVIHLNQSGSYKIALPAARLLRIPIAAHIRIFEDVGYLARQRPDRRRLRSVIAISKAMEDEILRHPGLADIPLRRLYDSYVPGPPPAAPPDAGAARLACVGRLVPIKGQDVLIRALGLLNRRRGSVACLFAGEGEREFQASLNRAVLEEGLESSISWMGFVRDVGPLLQTCRVLVCPSHREPLGRVIFEAWDAGAVPVAFAGGGGAAEIIAAASGGILYDEQTPESLSGAVETALDLPPEQAARLIQNGRDWMATHCDPVKYGRAVSSIFTEIRRAPSPPA